eukprot:Plantae.Rhodophyta-Purpureofilum_apyrenoidigerum.ctg44526.p1 GENE.Plantae.Rhodophyta-Purpureofilum_apyrenoidigerum.ctg44526~~Plantae.Rhodophyta-Purpureofilum_apyrenoidigerum.ctg44526.p1  ORF type:complete len:255 (+),score=39.55 Plantae.Rhodophyta-Purpureofilum_apyrenoidigerum.ctg44526:103-867(+)
MSNPFGSSEPLSTIDESVWSSIKRDLLQVGRRLRLVVMPGFSTEEIRAELRDWELWGPLFICMALAITLSMVAKDDASLVFSVIFVVVWAGSAVVTVNAQLLGGKISFFQTLCLLGYCIFPLLISTGACFIFNHFLKGALADLLRFVVVVVALFWAVWASASFLADARFPTGRKLLALYPVILFYLSLAWMIIIGFQQHSASSMGDTSPVTDNGAEATPSPTPVPSPATNDDDGGDEGDENKIVMFLLRRLLTN